MRRSVITVSCPLYLREVQLPVTVLDDSAPGHFLVNTCDNASGSAPECIECVRAAVTRLLKSREQSGYTG